jgi:hypothetical protein
MDKGNDVASYNKVYLDKQKEQIENRDKIRQKERAK